MFGHYDSEDDLQHDNRKRESRLRLFAVPFDLLRARDTAAVRKVPRCTIVHMRLVAPIMRCLCERAERKERRENSVNYQADWRHPDVHHHHGRLC